ncbi:MAG: putative transposase [Verrucomicrobiales bacterium]
MVDCEEDLRVKRLLDEIYLRDPCPGTRRLLALGIKISISGKGRWMDNVFIERLWRSLKYEEIYLRDHATLDAMRDGLERWFDQYNCLRPHQALGNLTPNDRLRET